LCHFDGHCVTFHSHMPTATFTLDMPPHCHRMTSTFTLGGVMFKVLLDADDGYVGIRPVTQFLTNFEGIAKISLTNTDDITVSTCVNANFTDNLFWGKNELVPKSWLAFVPRTFHVKVKLDVTGKYNELLFHILTAIVGGEEERVVADRELKYHALCASLVNIVTA
jgi:hypothetical protein